MADNEQDPRALARKIEAVGWGLLLIWIGTAFLVDIGWGAGLLGAGVIALGSQVARKYFGLPVEGFGLALGIVFSAWGIWELLQIGTAFPGGMVPLLFVGAGTLLIVSAFVRKPRH